MNWIMVKGLTVFVCGLALFGLAACGGGGGDGPPASDKAEMTIMPPLADHPNTLADAAPIMDGQTVTGVIDSPDDVDFFRLPVTEDSRVGFVLDAEAGLEIALLDSEGSVLDIAETESLARVGAIFLRGVALAKAGFSYVRVNCGRSLVAARGCAKKSFKLLATAQTYEGRVRAVIDFFRGRPVIPVDLSPLPAALSVEGKFDLKRFVRVYAAAPGAGGAASGFVLAWNAVTVTSPLVRGLSLAFSRDTTGTVTATSDVEPGEYRFKAAIEVPGTEGVITIGTDQIRTVTRKVFEIVASVRERTSGNNQDPTPPPQDPTTSPQEPTTPPGSGGGLMRVEGGGFCLSADSICPTSGSEFATIYECRSGYGIFNYFEEPLGPGLLSAARQSCEQGRGTFIIHKGA